MLTLNPDALKALEHEGLAPLGEVDLEEEQVLRVDAK